MTRHLHDPDDPRLMKFIAKEMARGEGLLGMPRDRGKRETPLMPVIRRHEILAERFPEEKVGILHGQISPEERGDDGGVRRRRHIDPCIHDRRGGGS